MRKVTLRAFAGVLVTSGCLFSACSSDPERAPMHGSNGGAGQENSGGRSGGSPSAGRGGAGTTGGASRGGESGDAGGAFGDAGHSGETGGAGSASGGDRGDAGSGAGDAGGAPPDPTHCPSDDSVEPIPVLGSVCDPAASWGAGKKALPAGADGDQLIAVTPDELSIVWFDTRGSVGTFRLADRVMRSADFVTQSDFPVRDVIALSPDGLRVAALSDDLGAVVEYVRPARGEAFAAGKDGTFAVLNQDALANGHRVLDAVIAPDDKTLYYNVTTNDDSEYPLHVSKRSGVEPWPVGEALEACEFKGFAGVVRHVTAVSADGLTLFFYDSARGAARAAFRRSATGPFLWFVDLGERYQATPNQSCDRLYYSASDALTSSSLFVADAE